MYGVSGFFANISMVPYFPEGSRIASDHLGFWTHCFWTNISGRKSTINMIYVDMHICTKMNSHIIYIYIYTYNIWRSPTRQYSVLSCFFPSSAASVFFLYFKKHFLLVVQANQVHQAEKHSKGWQHMFLRNKQHDTPLVLWALQSYRLHYRFGHVCSMYRSSPFRSTLNTGYITGLDMCAVCTEAVHSVALWTRVTLQVWTCVKYVPKQSIP